MRPEDLVASTLKHDPGYDMTLAKAYRAAHCVAEENGAAFTLAMSEYRDLLRASGYELFYADAWVKLRSTGIQYDVYRRYFRGERGA